MFAWNISGDGTISIVVNTKRYHVGKEHKSYDKIMNAIKSNDIKSIDSLVNEKFNTISEFIHPIIDKEVTFVGNRVRYLNKEVDGELVDTMIEYRSKGLPYLNLVNCLKKLMKNPSFRVRLGLYSFLKSRGCAIAEDGDFIGYKAIRHDWHDKRTGKIRNMIGDEPEQDRGLVDDNPSLECSDGLHVGSFDYARSFGSYSSDSEPDRLILVKVNPANVVSVPENGKKLRTCKYKVIAEHPIDKPLENVNFKSVQMLGTDLKGRDKIFSYSMKNQEEVSFEYKGETRYCIVNDFNDQYVKATLTPNDNNYSDFSVNYRMFNRKFINTVKIKIL